MTSADKPESGHYRVRLCKGGPWCALKLFHGPPADPETGEPLDRSPRWQALLDGAEADPWRFWPYCASDRITEAEYNHMLLDLAWVQTHHPDSTEANRSRVVTPE